MITITIMFVQTGDYYFPRADVVRQKYMVVTPPLADLKILGPYIMRECFWYDTFRLERIVEGGKIIDISKLILNTISRRFQIFSDSLTMPEFRNQIMQHETACIK